MFVFLFPQMEVDTVLSDFESSDFGEMVRHVISFTLLQQTEN